MTAQELLEVLAERGVSILAKGAELVLKPARLVPRELIPTLKAHKPELLGRLRLPAGWPDDVPTPPWWGELAVLFPPGLFLEAKRAECLDPDCRFPVAVLWPGHGQDGPTWSCPKCGLRTGCVPPGGQVGPGPGSDTSPEPSEPDPTTCRRKGDGGPGHGSQTTHGPQNPHGSQNAQPSTSPPELCRCGSTEYREVVIHEGQSIRRDCARCGRFLRFVVWHGRNQEDGGVP